MLADYRGLKRLVASVFANAGCGGDEAERIAHYLVESNLVGHDSHGVIRVLSYVRWLREGKVFANTEPATVLENEAILVLDGQFGFGQTAGQHAIERGIEKAARHGVAVVALRNSGHLGRIGDWPALAARSGLISMHFVNTSGGGILVAPFGGIDRRISANPIAFGVPIEGRPPILLDISTCSIAEGKIRVALNRGTTVPPGCIIDNDGLPTIEPARFYGSPPGAILPIAGHKGYGLGIIAEVLAGALTGGGCSDPNVKRVANGMLSVLIDPGRMRDMGEFAADIERFIEFVRSSRTVSPDGEILMPGELEERTRQSRMSQGINLDDKTWSEIREACGMVGLASGHVEDLLGS